ncbi:uncharacterized protein LOC135052435, partial [Pseudophryne corroboree]|uniref:uncharacterized protein LOC135052435 n=1 Tax=Pseudophryne corroboree TaxID=495146 RepID=UPI0030814FF3
LVVPRSFREQLMSVAHEIPLAGHQGRDRTLRRLTHNFFWPGVSDDVRTYCKSCDVCQRLGRPSARAPLRSLPIVGEPFQRVAVDIVGPLPVPSRSGKRYILTVVDYATRYPEAVALSAITAEKVADALLGIFSRVGFPSEVLTDQGTQFMSDLVQCLWAKCGVRQLRTAPYHPQTNGLCERFNGTLKQMLRAFVTSEGGDWERYLPHLLFAYREVPQESTGFSPFELLYGRRVHGPLDLFRESWEGELIHQDESVVEYVLKLRDRLENLMGLAQANLAEAQFAQAYLDDIAVFSRTWEEHLGHVGLVLERIRWAGLTIRADKCQMGMTEVQYLGHRVGGGKVKPEPAKVEAIRDWPRPTTQRQVLAFLGIAGYYRRFVPDFSSVAKPMTDLTKKKLPKIVDWTTACELAFQSLKTALVQAPVLMAPDYSKNFVVQTDASQYGLGAVLSQEGPDGQEHPVAYLSRKLLPREVGYATIEKECLAIVWAVKKLQPYLYGRHFTVVTDHNPLRWLQHTTGENGRLLRWSLALQVYDFHIIHKQGKAHSNADGLSRQEEPEPPKNSR